VNEPDGERPAAEFEHLVHVVVFFPNVNVNVLVGLLAVFMNVRVDLHPRSLSARRVAPIPRTISIIATGASIQGTI
jgi:hypothetical protein